MSYVIYVVVVHSFVHLILLNYYKEIDPAILCIRFQRADILLPFRWLHFHAAGIFLHPLSKQYCLLLYFITNIYTYSSDVNLNDSFLISQILGKDSIKKTGIKRTTGTGELFVNPFTNFDSLATSFRAYFKISSHLQLYAGRFSLAPLEQIMYRIITFFGSHWSCTGSLLWSGSHWSCTGSSLWSLLWSSQSIFAISAAVP